MVPTVILQIVCVVILTITLRVNGQSHCDFGSGMIFQKENNNSTPISESGQFIDIARPATCNGEISKISFCYLSRTELSTTTSEIEITLRIWRLVEGNSQILEIVDEYIFSAPVSSSSEASIHPSSCVSESIGVSETIQFQQGDVVGFLFPHPSGSYLAFIDSVLAEEGIGLYRDNRPEEIYGSPLDLEADVDIEVGLRFNIQVEVAEMSVNGLVNSSLTSSVQNSTNVPNSYDQFSSTPTLLSTTPVTMLTSVIEFAELSPSMNSNVHATMSTFHESISRPVKPSAATQLVPSISNIIPMNNSQLIVETLTASQSTNMAITIVDVSIASISITPTAFTTTGITITKSVSNNGESMIDIEEITRTSPTPTQTVLASDGDLGLLSPYTIYDEDTLSLDTATYSPLFGETSSTTTTNTEESVVQVFGTNSMETDTIISHAGPQLIFATESIDLSSSLSPGDGLEESPTPDDNGAFNEGSGESEYSIEVITESTSPDDELLTIFSTMSFISPSIVDQTLALETSPVMSLELNSDDDDLTTFQNRMASSALQQSTLESSSVPTPSISSVDVSAMVNLLPSSPGVSLPSLNPAISTSQIPLSETAIFQLSSIITSSMNTMVDTTPTHISSTRNAFMTSVIAQSGNNTPNLTMISPTTNSLSSTGTPMQSNTSLTSIFSQTPTIFPNTTTEYLPDYKPELKNGLATWVSLLVLLFAMVSGCVMFVALYFAHYRKLAKGKSSSTSSPNALLAIDNPSYSAKSSEDNESQPILMDTYTEECLDQSMPVHANTSGNNDNTSMDSQLMDGSSHNNSALLGNNSPSKNTPISSLATDLSVDKGPSEVQLSATIPKNSKTSTLNSRDTTTAGDKRLSSALSSRTHDYEELSNDPLVANVSKRQSHQYDEPESIPEERPPTEAQDYETPVSLQSQHLSLTLCEEDAEEQQEVLRWRNCSTGNEVSESSDLASESISMVSGPQRIHHYAEFSLYPSEWCASPLYRSKPKKTSTTQKNHSFSYSKSSKHHDYEEPLPHGLSNSHSASFVPMPSMSFKAASDYEVPVSSKSLQRTQSTKPEQLSMALKRRNRLSLIFEADSHKVEEESTFEHEEFETHDDTIEEFNAMKLRIRQDSTPSSLKSSPFLISEMDGAYIVPSSDEQELNSEIDRQSVTVIPYSAIESDWRLNEPEQRAVWKRDLDSSRIDVTIRSPDSTDTDSSSSSSNKVEILQEVAMMAQFRHPNIVKLHGAVNDGRHTILVSEYFHRGDLRKVLVQMGRSEIPSDTPQLLLSYSQQAALGMQYLASKGFVHRDLSARNVYVSKSDICKVGGFDKSRELANVNDYIAKGGKMQVRWMSPEAIHHCQYSTASDVWSYGCLLYEIWSLGRMPFRDNSNSEVIDKVDSGNRLPPPPGCPLVIYNLMMQCWHPNPFSRPCFKGILSTLLKDDDSILKIPIKDASTHSSAIILGASLKAGTFMYTDLQQKYARRASHINRRSVSFKSHDYDHIEDEKFMLSFPTSSADLASERKSKKQQQQQFEFEESCDMGAPRPTLYSEPVVVSKFSQSLPLSTWKGSDYEDIIDV